MNDTAPPPVLETAPAKTRHYVSRPQLIAIAAVIAAAVAIAVLLTYLSGGTDRQSRRPTTTVGVAKAEIGEIPIELNALGTVTPVTTVVITSRVAGMLLQLPFKEGQIVHAGDVMALIDDRPFVAALQQAKGNQARDQALLDNARVDVQRYRSLLSQRAISSQQVDTQAALVRQDEGLVASDKAAIATAQLNVDYCRITAPLAGRVGLRQVDPGNYIAVGASNPIVTITQVDPIDVVFTLPEDNVTAVNAQTRAGTTLPVTAFDRAGAKELAAGSLLTLDISSTPRPARSKPRRALPMPTKRSFPISS